MRGLITLIAIPFLYLLNGYVLSKLWAWFIVSMFEVSMYSLPYFIGLGITISFLTSHSEYKKQNKEETEESKNEKLVDQISTSILKALLVLGIAFIVKQFV